MDAFKVPTVPTATTREDDVVAKKHEDELPSNDERASDEAPIKTVSNIATSCPYKVPAWSAPPPANVSYKFEVLKSGQIIEEVKDLQCQANWQFGRLTDNDIEMAHPTISRFHAVLQYRPKTETTENAEDEHRQQPAEGWYIYDLGSTHGTFLNKQQIPPRVFIRIRVGHILRLGASTRSYILQGPVEDEEAESELSVTELRAQRQTQQAEAIAEKQRIAQDAETRERSDGISWGMSEDADEETDLMHNPYASTNNEDLFLDDPKRTLRGYFEREGLTLEYKCDEMSTGSFVCRVELPIDDTLGRPLIAEVVHKGRKKECVVQCALEACRILDRHGVLRQANQEPLKRKVKSKDSGSDDDEFWDRTGDVERKKLRKSNANTSVSLTYEDLLQQEVDLLVLVQKVESDVEKYQETQKRLKATKARQENEGDDLDSYMDNLSEGATQLDKTVIRKLRLEQQRLKAEQSKLQRLIQIAKPHTLSFACSAGDASTSEGESNKTETVKKQLPMIGKRNQFSKFKAVKMPNLGTPTTTTSTKLDASKVFASDEEETEEEPQELKKKEDEIIPEITEQETDQADKIKIKKPLSPSKNNEAAVIPREIEHNAEHSTEEIDHTDGKPDDPGTVVDTELPHTATSDEATDGVAKKRRHRQRLRNKRQEIDELEQHESSEKYAKWVPPENQSGDGYTELNKKYGY